LSEIQIARGSFPQHYKFVNNLSFVYGVEHLTFCQSSQGAMVLTVYESKGLEFDDVILFDFFNDSPCEWTSVVNDIDIDEEEEQQQQSNEEDGKERVAKTTLASLSPEAQNNKNPNKNKTTGSKTANLSALLCSELKHLYTAVTRAKSRLFLFDRDVAKRSPLFDFWRKHNLVEELTTESKIEATI